MKKYSLILTFILSNLTLKASSIVVDISKPNFRKLLIAIPSFKAKKDSLLPKEKSKIPCVKIINLATHDHHYYESDWISVPSSIPWSYLSNRKQCSWVDPYCFLQNLDRDCECKS